MYVYRILMNIICKIDGTAKKFIDRQGLVNNTITLLAKLIRDKSLPFPYGVDRPV